MSVRVKKYIEVYDINWKTSCQMRMQSSRSQMRRSISRMICGPIYRFPPCCLWRGDTGEETLEENLKSIADAHGNKGDRLHAMIRKNL